MSICFGARRCALLLASFALLAVTSCKERRSFKSEQAPSRRAPRGFEDIDTAKVYGVPRGGIPVAIPKDDWTWLQREIAGLPATVKSPLTQVPRSRSARATLCSPTPPVELLQEVRVYLSKASWSEGKNSLNIGDSLSRVSARGNLTVRASANTADCGATSTLLDLRFVFAGVSGTESTVESPTKSAPSLHAQPARETTLQRLQRPPAKRNPKE